MCVPFRASFRSSADFYPGDPIISCDIGRVRVCVCASLPLVFAPSDTPLLLHPRRVSLTAAPLINRTRIVVVDFSYTWKIRLKVDNERIKCVKRRITREHSDACERVHIGLSFHAIVLLATFKRNKSHFDFQPLFEFLAVVQNEFPPLLSKTVESRKKMSK